MKIDIVIKACVPILILASAIVLVPLLQLQFFDAMPGDVGDARLNNYFLENVYQFFFGKSDSLWHLPFFYPFPFVLGFSDNLFGSAPAYILARSLGAASDTAFQVWFLIGYLVNFWAAYYALRKLGASSLAASVGALIFAFALPTTAYVDHAQLHYRFGIPLAVVFFIEFLNKKNWKAFVIAGAWLVWQFYAGVYMGFFTALLLVAMLVTYLVYEKFKCARTMKSVLYEFVVNWGALPSQNKLQHLLSLAILSGLGILLFYPYLQVSHLYGATRDWIEISSMLPRLQSYFLSDRSLFWSNRDAAIFAGIPMRHEHQMFLGMIPLVLTLLGLFWGNRTKNGTTYTLMAWTLGLTIILTLYVGGYSLWYFLHKLPLASAIRVMARVELALLFPIAYLAAIGIDNIRARFVWGAKLVGVFILPVLLLEMSMTSMSTSPKEIWRLRVSQADQLVPADLPKDAIIFMAQRKGPGFSADELDAMWVALNRGVNTLNGHSGFLPRGYSRKFSNDCSELSNRIVTYLNFSKTPDPESAYQEIVLRTIPIGFDNCEQYLRGIPSTSYADRAYSQDEIVNLSYKITPLYDGADISGVYVIITNTADFPFSAGSKTGNPLRLSWRFFDSEGIPLSGWDTRKNLPMDIPGKDKLTVLLPLSIPPNAVTLQVSMVQEKIFWAHNVGIEPALLSLK